MSNDEVTQFLGTYAKTLIVESYSCVKIQLCMNLETIFINMQVESPPGRTNTMQGWVESPLEGPV